jgi:hypothetical protein
MRLLKRIMNERDGFQKRVQIKFEFELRVEELRELIALQELTHVPLYSLSYEGDYILVFSKWLYNR